MVHRRITAAQAAQKSYAFTVVATDAITASQTVFHQPGMESFILLPVMPR